MSHLRAQGLVAFARHIDEKGASLPVMHTDTYYQRNPSKDTEVGELGMEILAQLKHLSRRVADAEEGDLFNQSTALAKVAQCARPLDGYRNLVMSELARGVAARALLRLTVLGHTGLEELRGLADQICQCPSWGVLYDVLVAEGVDIELDREALTRMSSYEAYASIYNYFRPNSKGASREIEGLIVFENEYHAKHNYEKLDVPGLVCLLFVVRAHCDVLSGLLEMRESGVTLPTTRPEFSTLARARISAIKTQKKCFVSAKPYAPHQFWKFCFDIRKNGASRDFFFRNIPGDSGDTTGGFGGHNTQLQEGIGIDEGA